MLYVYGPDPTTLQGRMTRRRPDPIPALGYLPLSPSILEQHPKVQLSVDIFLFKEFHFYILILLTIIFAHANPLEARQSQIKQTQFVASHL